MTSEAVLDPFSASTWNLYLLRQENAVSEALKKALPIRQRNKRMNVSQSGMSNANHFLSACDAKRIIAKNSALVSHLPS